MMKLVQVQTRIEPGTFAELSREAADDRRSVASLLRLIVEQHVNEYEFVHGEPDRSKGA